MPLCTNRPSLAPEAALCVARFEWDQGAQLSNDLFQHVAVHIG